MPRRGGKKKAAQKAAESSNTKKESSNSDMRVTVALRVRPLLATEEAEGKKALVSCLAEKVVVLSDPNANSDDVLRKKRSHERRFAFDVVLSPESTQHQVYRMTTRPLLRSFVAGYNCTIFAYGATSSGIVLLGCH